MLTRVLNAKVSKTVCFFLCYHGNVLHPMDVRRSLSKWKWRDHPAGWYLQKTPMNTRLVLVQKNFFEADFRTEAVMDADAEIPEIPEIPGHLRYLDT